MLPVTHHLLLCNPYGISELTREMLYIDCALYSSVHIYV